MEWAYGDDPGHYQFDEAWNAFSATAVEEELPVMTIALSPRAAAQKAVDQLRKLDVQHYNGGKWSYHTELDVVLLDPPRHVFMFAFHRPTLKFFRSATKNSLRLTCTSLRRVIDPERAWIVDAMKNIVPDGGDFLAYERGDQTVMTRRAAALSKIKESSSEREQVQPAETPPPQPARPIESAQEHSFMALLDVQRSSRKIIVEEITRTLDLDRKQLVSVLRQAGAPTLKRNAQIRLLTADGESIEIDENAKIRIEWTESKETEEAGD